MGEAQDASLRNCDGPFAELTITLCIVVNTVFMAGALWHEPRRSHAPDWQHRE